MKLLFKIPLVVCLIVGGKVSAQTSQSPQREQASQASQTSQASQASSRVSINEGWEFMKTDTAVTAKQLFFTGPRVNLPHSWNGSDVMDDSPGYYRGIGWYRKELILESGSEHQQYDLRFDGANQSARVYVNGRLIGEHDGGYTAFQFRIPIDSIIRDRVAASEATSSTGTGSIKLEILVRVDNRYNPDIPPLTADFSFFGGLYRNAWLVTTGRIHFDRGNLASDGIFISTPHVSAAAATVRVHGVIVRDGSKQNAEPVFRNGDPGPGKPKIRLVSMLRDAAGKVVARATDSTFLPNGETMFDTDFDPIRQPHLWSPSDPYLYSLQYQLISLPDGAVLDEITRPVGLRWFRFSADSGFFLNGRPLKLVGASRHQDRPGLGNAVPSALATQDVRLLKQMGGNFLRVAHYPQDPVVLEACDRLGILASVEIPVVNEITENEAFNAHCLQMQREMIRQNYNHPCVVVWCYMNEILLRPHFNDDKQRQLIYYKRIEQLAASLDSVTRREDSTRYTMMAFHGDFARYRSTGLTAIPQLVGWNLYSGWYGGQLQDFASFLDRHHRELPGKPLLVSEYGADADPRIRSLHPVRFDKSVDYALLFHQYYLAEMLKRPFVSAAIVWNLADFNSETREETMPHINNKGLLEWDRTPKDPYHFYQARLRKDAPVLKILTSGWHSRTGISDTGAVPGTVLVQRLLIATNQPQVNLYLDGQLLGAIPVRDGIATFNVPLHAGLNNLVATAAGGAKKKSVIVSDTAGIRVRILPSRFTDTAAAIGEFNLLLGGDRFFTDPQTGDNWQPDQPYRPGGWGHVGGRSFMLKGNTRLPYGTDKNILHTEIDPVYQTQLVGIGSYRFDVPDGQYQLVLHFAELSGSTAMQLAYNLSQSAKDTGTAQRIFSVSVNGRMLADSFNLAKEYGVATAVKLETLVTVKDGKGLEVLLRPIIGEAVLNAVQLRKTVPAGDRSADR